MLALVAYSLKSVKLLGPCKRTQHCWPKTALIHITWALEERAAPKDMLFEPLCSELGCRFWQKNKTECGVTLIQLPRFGQNHVCMRATSLTWGTAVQKATMDSCDGKNQKTKLNAGWISVTLHSVLFFDFYRHFLVSFRGSSLHTHCQSLFDSLNHGSHMCYSGVRLGSSVHVQAIPCWWAQTRAKQLSMVAFWTVVAQVKLVVRMRTWFG